MSDTVDINIGDIIFEQKGDQKVERKPWEIFGHKVSRSLLVFIFQILLLTIVVVVSLVKLSLAETCDETTVWVALLASAFGYIIPSPSKPS